MPLSITLRRGSDISPFRRQLLRLIDSPRGDAVVLCTGYVTEGEKQHYYSVLNDKLLQALKTGASSGLEVYGGMLKPDWSADNFSRFVERLIEAGLPVQAFVSETKRWHAKIALRLEENRPIAAIIGSSNLTGAAYAENQPFDWNYECDVTIWLDETDLNAYFSQRPTDVDDLDWLAAILDPDLEQANEEKRLLSLLDEVRDQRQAFRP